MPPFTLIGATTRAGLLTSPLRDRFGITQRLEFYNINDLATIVKRSSKLLNMTIEEEGALEIASRSRGTPRIANRLLRRVRDFAEVKAKGIASFSVAKEALGLLDVDNAGFDIMDRRFIQTIIERFNGGPAGLDSIAAAIGEAKDTIEELIEPYLIQQGFIIRTPRGRIASNKSYQHFGLPINTKQDIADFPAEEV